MSPIAFQAIGIQLSRTKYDCINDLKKSFHSSKTKLTGDATVEDLCDLKHAKSKGYQKAKHTWTESISSHPGSDGSSEFKQIGWE